MAAFDLQGEMSTGQGLVAHCTALGTRGSQMEAIGLWRSSMQALQHTLSKKSRGKDRMAHLQGKLLRPAYSQSESNNVRAGSACETRFQTSVGRIRLPNAALKDSSTTQYTGQQQS
jgi:hypothetical protein